MKKLIITVLCLATLAFGVNRKYIHPRVNTVGLIAHYKLWAGLTTSGEVFDYSLNSNTGVLTDTDDPITLVPAYPGFSFDGTEDYISIADDASFSPVLTPMSISAWAYMDDATFFIIASKYMGGEREWWFGVNIDDKFCMALYDESALASIGRMYTVAMTSYESRWIHLAATYDGGTLSSGVKLYLNGGLIDNTNYQGGTFVALENLTQPVTIGKRAPAHYANGTIDDVMIFDVEKTAADIKNIYEVTRWRYQR